MMSNSVWWVVGLLALGYGSVCLYLFMQQERMLFFPSRDWFGTPADIGMEYEAVECVTADGVVLSGWFLPGRQGRVVLFFHGNGGNISHRLESLKIFADLGLACLIIDYRGYGQSQGEISEEGLAADGEAAWRYLVDQRRFSARDIVVFGRSLGAAVGARLASEQEVGALIVESGFASVPALARQLYPFLPVGLLCRYRFDTAHALQSVACPVLIVHSPDDELVPFGQAEKLFAAAQEPKGFLKISGGHNDGFLKSGPRYIGGLEAFLKGIGKDESCD